MVWNTLKIEDKIYAFRIVRNFGDCPEHDTESLLTFWLSDFRVIYMEQLKLKELFHRATVENPIVEFESRIVLETILDGDSPQLQLVGEESDDNSLVRLKCKYYVSQLPFHFYWKLERQSAEVFYEEITKVLFGSLLDAQTQSKHLLDVIQSKDLEIEQYKIDGAELIRKHLATKPFVRNAFEESAHSHSTEIQSLLQIAKTNSVTFGIASSWSADHNNGTIENKVGSPANATKRPSSTSPGKPAKRTTKEILARSKIISGPDASVNYADNEEEDVEPEEAFSPQRNHTIKESPKTSPAKSVTSVRKIKTKLNL